MGEGVSPVLPGNGFSFSSEIVFSGSLSVSGSVSGSFYGGGNFPTFDFHNGISSTNRLSPRNGFSFSREIDPLSHTKDPIPLSGFRSHFLHGYRDAAGLFLGRGYSHSSTPGIVSKSWVPEPGFRSVHTPTPGVLTQVTLVEIPISRIPDLGLTGPSGYDTPDPVVGSVKGDIGELSLGYQNVVKTSAAESSLSWFPMASAGIPELVTDGYGSIVPDPAGGGGKGNDDGWYKASALVTARMDGEALGLYSDGGYGSLDCPIQTGGRCPDPISGEVPPVLCIAAKVLHFGFCYCYPVFSPLGLPFSMGLWIIPLFYVYGRGLGVLFDSLIKSESFSATMDFVRSSDKILIPPMLGMSAGKDAVIVGRFLLCWDRFCYVVPDVLCLWKGSGHAVLDCISPTRSSRDLKVSCRRRYDGLPAVLGSEVGPLDGLKLGYYILSYLKVW